MACMQAYAALLEHVRCNVAPAVCSGAVLLATLRSTRLLPTGCERHGPLEVDLHDCSGMLKSPA